MPLVSIITPTYNRPDLLGEAIASMLAQSFDDWEMLVADDGSEPSARPVVDGDADPRLRYMRLEHVGRSAARNRALELARGDYIGFLDDDDLYHSDKLSHEIAFLQANPEVDIVGSGYRSVDREGNVVQIFERWRQTPEVNVANCLYGVPLITCSVLIARDAIDRMDHWFDPAFDILEDSDFFIRLILAGARFAWLKEIMSDYRHIHHQDNDMLLQMRRAYHRVLAKIIKIPDLPPEVTRQSHSALVAYDLNRAWWAYAKCLDKTPQRYLLQALFLEPQLADEQAHVLLEGLAKFARNRHYVAEPYRFIDHVLANLPAPLRHLADRGQVVKVLVAFEGGSAQ